MDNGRFKIDFNPGSRGYFIALFYRMKGFWGNSWKEIYTFDSIEEAKKHYEKIKDLPEYLP